MRSSIKSYPNQNPFRYCSSSSPKLLTPKSLNSAPSSNSVITIFSLHHSSLRPSVSRLLPKNPALSIPFSGSYSVLQFSPRSSQIKLSGGSSSSGPASNSFYIPFLPVKNQFLGHSLCGLPLKFEIDLWSLSTNLSQYVCSGFWWLRCGKMARFYTVSSSDRMIVGSDSVVESEVHRKHSRGRIVLDVVNTVRDNGEDLESRLNELHPRLNAYSITEIFEVLNAQKVPGLRLFEWVWSNNPKLHKNACVCSLVIDNLGRLEDYETMRTLFRKFTNENICLTYDAFGFLPVLASTDALLKESIGRVLGLLNEVGGSCQSSGVYALIEMFCKFHLFEMAKHVIKIEGRKASYYCLLIREKCSSGLVEDAHDIIREMREAHCAPTTTVYNYLLGSLWKHSRMTEASSLLDEMKENDIPLDAITYEILINTACSLGNMDGVHQLLHQMVTRGLQPRLSTHAFVIKNLFAAEKYEAAHKYVVDSSANDKPSSNTTYSLMAKLYCEKGHIMSARSTLVDMMENGLKPNFSIYLKIVKQLRRSGRGNLARDLESRHSKFTFNPHVACL